MSNSKVHLSEASEGGHIADCEGPQKALDARIRHAQAQPATQALNHLCANASSNPTAANRASVGGNNSPHSKRWEREGRRSGGSNNSNSSSPTAQAPSGMPYVSGPGPTLYPGPSFSGGTGKDGEITPPKPIPNATEGLVIKRDYLKEQRERIAKAKEERERRLYPIKA